MVEAAGRTGRFELDSSGPYSLAASVRFLEGFAPARYEGDGSERLRFAFFADGLGDCGERVAGALVDQEGDKVVVETFGEAATRRCGTRFGASSRWTRTGAAFRGSGCETPWWGNSKYGTRA